MNQREKVLAGCLVGTLVGFGGYRVVKSWVIEPGRQLVKDIADERGRKDRLEVQLNSVDKIVSAWRAQTAQTLDVEVFEADQVFRKDVDELLKRNKLMAEKSSIGQSKVHVEKKGVREGFGEVSLSVTATGTLADLVNFLKDFYQRPYLVRVDKLSLSADKSSRSRSRSRSRLSTRRRPGPSAEPRLTIMMTLTTLVLPKVEDIDHPTIDLAAFDDPEREVELTIAPRLHEEDPVTYNEIASVNIFKIYEPPPPPPPIVVKEPDKPKVSQPAVKTQDLPRVDPRRDAHKFVVNGVGRLPDGPVAYVVNSDDATQPPTPYRLNDDVDDGKVVLIVPEGMVVRLSPEGARREPPKNYFYALGLTFKDRKEVNPADHPDIAYLLRTVLKQ